MFDFLFFGQTKRLRNGKVEVFFLLIIINSVDATPPVVKFALAASTMNDQGLPAPFI